MGSEIMGLKEVGIFIIGLFGLEELLFKAIKQLLDHSIANSEHKHCLCGSQLNNLLNKAIDHMNPLFFLLTKDITVNSVH